MSRSLPFRPIPGGSPSRGADADALDRLFRAEAPKLTRFFHRRMRQSEDVPDMVQEVFARFAHVSLNAPLRKPEAYLQRIARNLLFDRGRNLAARAARRQVPLDDTVCPSVAPTQAHAIEAEQMRALYERTIAALPERTCEIFLMHRRDERSYKDIAADLGISLGAVEYHIGRALMALVAVLEQE
jgi:RNA polymerase sigma-70 factor (ECF subfamily)